MGRLIGEWHPCCTRMASPSLRHWGAEYFGNCPGIVQQGHEIYGFFGFVKRITPAGGGDPAGVIYDDRQLGRRSVARLIGTALGGGVRHSEFYDASLFGPLTFSTS